jgi:hypothetical protein
MNVRPTSPWLAALATSILSLALGACGRVPGQFEILNDQIPASSISGCTVPVNATEYMGTGLLDLSIVDPGIGSAYLFFPLIENNLPSSSGSTIDPNQIQLSGFQIDITPLGAAPSISVQSVFDSAGALTHFQVPWSGGVKSGGGQISAIVGAFPIELAQQLLATSGVGSVPSLTVDLTVSALGTTNSGSHMTSDPFHFPLQICSGCLATSLGPCSALSVAPANMGNACNPAQDAPVDCCSNNGALICPSPMAAQ